MWDFVKTFGKIKNSVSSCLTLHLPERSNVMVSDKELRRQSGMFASLQDFRLLHVKEVSELVGETSSVVLVVLVLNLLRCREETYKILAICLECKLSGIFIFSLVKTIGSLIRVLGMG